MNYCFVYLFIVEFYMIKYAYLLFIIVHVVYFTVYMIRINLDHACESFMHSLLGKRREGIELV
jgi:hypothetical protein